MVPFRISPIRLVATLVLAAVVLAAASYVQSQDSGASKQERIVPDTVPAKPFSTIATRQTPLYTVEFRSADQLTQQDRLVLADAESSIAEHAGFAGLEYQQNNWNYRQIVCPTFPNHLFLQYTRNNGAGDMSVFSASIPRNGEGRVRIVPILKRGYSLFSPAPINALTISAFNHIRAEEGEAANSDWLGNALCYAALAGSQPQILPHDCRARRAQADSRAYRCYECRDAGARDGSDPLCRRRRAYARNGVVDDLHASGKTDQGHA